MTTDDKINELFNEMVPDSGEAATVAGELIRAVERIRYRWQNDGDICGEGYGNETVNPSVRYLRAWIRSVDSGIVVNNTFVDAVFDLFSYIGGPYRSEPSRGYSKLLTSLAEGLVQLIEDNPELKRLQNDEDSRTDYARPEDCEQRYDDEEEDYPCYRYDGEEED